MIVVDENIQDHAVIQAIASWYPGQVISVMVLRLQTLIKDDGIAMLLHQANDPTFVTTNVDDFWPKFPAHRHYCIVNIALTIEETVQVPDTLRNLLRLPQFRTKAARMGKVIRVRPSGIEYYQADRRIQFLPWLA